MSSAALTLGLALGGGPRVAAAVLLWDRLGMSAVVAVAVVVGAARIRARTRRSDRLDEATFLGVLAVELRSGSPLVLAIEAAAEAGGDHVLQAEARRVGRGAPATALFDSLALRLPRHGREAAFAARLTADDGGAAAPTFGRLFVRATRDEEAARELRALTAQARLSLLIVAGAPLVVLVALATGGGIELLWRAGVPGRVALVSGISAVAGGVGLSLLMLIRAARQR